MTKRVFFSDQSVARGAFNADSIIRDSDRRRHLLPLNPPKSCVLSSVSAANYASFG